MELPSRKLSFVAERRTFDPWKVIRIACRSTSKGLRLDKIAKLVQGQNSRNRLFIEDREALLFIWRPSFGYPLDDPLGQFAE